MSIADKEYNSNNLCNMCILLYYLYYFVYYVNCILYYATIEELYYIEKLFKLIFF